jgi:hypothetical protein
LAAKTERNGVLQEASPGMSPVLRSPHGLAYLLTRDAILSGNDTDLPRSDIGVPSDPEFRMAAGNRTPWVRVKTKSIA